MQITGGFGYQRLSGYQQLVEWRRARAAMTSDFQSVTAAASDTFANAHINQAYGLATLAAKAGVQRVQDAAKAKIAKLTAGKIA